MRTGTKNKNSGFSFVELIVVIAILALMMGMFLLSTNILNNRAARQTARQIKQELDQVRIATMGKNEVVVHLYTDAKGKVIVRESVTAPKIGDTGVHTYDDPEKEIGSKRATVYVGKTGGDKPAVSDNVLGASGKFVELNDVGVYIKFNRSTGALEEVSGVTGQVTGKIQRFDIVGGGKLCSVIIRPVTGKVEYIE